MRHERGPQHRGDLAQGGNFAHGTDHAPGDKFAHRDDLVRRHGLEGANPHCGQLAGRKPRKPVACGRRPRVFDEPGLHLYAQTHAVGCAGEPRRFRIRSLSRYRPFPSQVLNPIIITCTRKTIQAALEQTPSRCPYSAILEQKGPRLVRRSPRLSLL